MTSTAHNEMVCLPDSPLELARLVDAAITKLAGAQLGLVADADVLATVAVLETAWRRADGVNAALLVEVSDREVFTAAGCKTVKSFYAEHHRLGHFGAKRRLEVAEAISPMTAMTGEKLPPKREPLAKGVADGEVSAEHVHAIESVMAKIPHSAAADELTAAVAIMAEAARGLAPADLGALGQRVLAHLDPDGTLTDDKDRRRMRGITIGRQDEQLMSKISGYLTPAVRAKLEVLLDNWARPGMNNPDDEQSPSGSVGELGDEDREALAEAVRTDTRTPAQRNHDAIEQGLDWVLGHEALGRPNRIPAQLTITVDEADLARHAGVALTATGTMVPIADLIALAADAVPWLAVFKTFTREVVNFGRGRRLATMGQRLALFSAYRGCSRPGCTRPFSHTEAHHGVLDYAKGGRTDLSDLAPACGPDNRNVGDQPGQWETGLITNGPDAGLIGWRRAGTDEPYRVNRVHDPGAYLRGNTVDADQGPPEPRGITVPDSPPPRSSRTEGPTMPPTRPEPADDWINTHPSSPVEAVLESLMSRAA